MHDVRPEGVPESIMVGRQRFTVVGWKATRNGQYRLSVTCNRCGRKIKQDNLIPHLDKHDTQRDREEMRKGGVGSFVKPVPGQLAIPGTEVDDVPS